VPDAPSALPELDAIPDPLSVVDAPLQARVGPRASAGLPRGAVRKARWVGALVSLAWLAGQLGIIGIRFDMPKVPLGYTLGFAVAPALGSLVCFVVALTPGRLGLGLRVGVLSLLALLGPVAFAVASYAFSPPYPDAPLGTFANGVFCFNIAVAFTVVPLVVAGFALKSAFAASPVYKSALIGAGAGLLVSTTSMLRCPLSGAWHMALSHGGAVIVSALIGGLLLSRVTRA